jgi:hypothetical protein
MSKFTDRLATAGIDNTTTVSDGIWSQIKTTMPYDPMPAMPLSEIINRLNKLEVENKCLRLKILGMEGKFSQDEIKNIRAMLISNDDASVMLANTIIENA